MTRITLDPTLAKALLQLRGRAELCDPSGNVIGQFVPPFDPSEFVRDDSELSEEELARRLNETESYSTAEVLAHLESLACIRSDGKSQS